MFLTRSQEIQIQRRQATAATGVAFAAPRPVQGSNKSTSRAACRYGSRGSIRRRSWPRFAALHAAVLLAGPTDAALGSGRRCRGSGVGAAIGSAARTAAVPHSNSAAVIAAARNFIRPPSVLARWEQSAPPPHAAQPAESSFIASAFSEGGDRAELGNGYCTTYFAATETMAEGEASPNRNADGSSSPSLPAATCRVHPCANFH